MAEVIETVATKAPKTASKASKVKNGKPTAKEIAKVVKKAKVKLTKEQEEYCKTLTKEEQAFYREHGSLRGIARSKPLDLGESKMGGFDSTDVTTLRLPQVRILIVLSKAKGLLNRKTISAYSGVEEAWMRNWIGQPDKDARLNREQRWGFTSLVTIGACRFDEFEEEGRTAIGYEITDKGRKLLAKYKDECGDKYKEMEAKVVASTKATK